MKCSTIFNMMTGSDPLIDFLPVLVFVAGFALARFARRYAAVRAARA